MRVLRLGFGVWGLGVRAWGPGFVGFRVQGLGVRDQGLGLRAWSVGCRLPARQEVVVDDAVQLPEVGRVNFVCRGTSPTRNCPPPRTSFGP